MKMNNRIFTYFGVITVLMFSLIVNAQSRDRVTVENIYFSILNLPSNGMRGEMQVFLSNEAGDGKCTSVTCVSRYKFSEDLMIRVAGQTATMSLSTLPRLPQQRAYVVVENGQVVTLGFRELVVSTTTFNDI